MTADRASPSYAVARSSPAASRSRRASPEPVPRAAERKGPAVLVEQLERLPANGLLACIRLGAHRVSRGLTGDQDGRCASSDGIKASALGARRTAAPPDEPISAELEDFVTRRSGELGE